MILNRFYFCCSLIALSLAAGAVFASDDGEKIIHHQVIQTNTVAQKSMTGAVVDINPVHAGPMISSPECCDGVQYETVQTLVQTVPPTNPKFVGRPMTRPLPKPGNCGAPSCYGTALAFGDYMTAEELARRRELAAAGGYVDPWVDHYDKGSCPPWMGTDECRTYMASDHVVMALPAVAPSMPVLSDHDRYTERTVEELFLNPHHPNSYWVNGMDDASHDTVRGDWTDLAPLSVVDETIVGAPAAPSVAQMSDFVGTPTAAANVACGPVGQTVAYETCGGTVCVDCPFDTDWECGIWLKKPHVKEAVYPRSKKIKKVNIDSLVALLNAGNEINVDMQDAAPLVRRYEKLMDMSRACCTDGMVYNLKRAGASEGLVYKYLVDDANFYGFGDRCLMMTDADLDRYGNAATTNVVADVRNGCLCRQKEWFKSLLAPFQQVDEQVYGFSQSRFDYTYVDGLQRTVTTSINTDVRTVLEILATCP